MLVVFEKIQTENLDRKERNSKGTDNYRILLFKKCDKLMEKRLDTPC